MRPGRLPCVLALIGLTSFAGPALADPVDREPEDCRLLGRVFWRLAEDRDDGAGKDYAVTRIDRWLADMWKTGTNVRVDRRQYVAHAADYVFGHAALNRATLSYFAVNQCQLETAFAKDPKRKAAGTVLLENATRECQTRHPGIIGNGELQGCIMRAREKIVAAVAAARIVVK